MNLNMHIRAIAGVVTVVGSIIFCWGCGPVYPERYASAREDCRNASVVVFCTVSVTRTAVVNRIAEIWRDRSGGKFTMKIGDEYTEPRYNGPDAQHFYYGKTSVLLFRLESEELRYSGTMSFQEDKCAVWGDKSKDEVKAILEK